MKSQETDSGVAVVSLCAMLEVKEFTSTALAKIE